MTPAPDSARATASAPKPLTLAVVHDLLSLLYSGPPPCFACGSAEPAAVEWVVGIGFRPFCAACSEGV